MALSFIPALHGLRGIAALAVLLFHWQQFFPAGAMWLKAHSVSDTVLDPSIYLGFGWLGVPLFFILSGYLLGAQVTQSELSGAFVSRFWARRFLRIYPAVWAELLLLLLVSAWFPDFISNAGMESLHLQFLLWINLPPAMATPINLVWWTLPVELCFYLTLPLLGYLARFLGAWGLLVLGLIVTMSWRFWIFSTADVTNYLKVLPVLDSLPGVFFTFMLGFCLNSASQNVSHCARYAVFWGAVLALLCLMQWQLGMNDVYWRGHWILLVWPPLVACCIAALVFCLERPLLGWRWLDSPILIWLGHVSFGIYPMALSGFSLIVDVIA